MVPPFIDMLEQRKGNMECAVRAREVPAAAAGEALASPAVKVGKGARRMPWLWKATKDAASCEKPGLGAGDL